jgi:hypothetical protein
VINLENAMFCNWERLTDMRTGQHWVNSVSSTTMSGRIKICLALRLPKLGQALIHISRQLSRNFGLRRGMVCLLGIICGGSKREQLDNKKQSNSGQFYNCPG